MADREPKYSLSEIDRMRTALRRMHLSFGGNWKAETEDQLRTHMVNGTKPEDLEAAATEFCVKLQDLSGKPGTLVRFG